MNIIKIALLMALTGCLPAQLDKYRSQDKQGPGIGSDAAPASSVADKRRAMQPGSQSASSQPQQQAPARATIYAVDKQTFRFALRDGEVWESALNVLLRNYSLTIVDRQSGIVATEWDSYFLSGAVYRNKITMRLARSQGGVDVTIHNSVERLRDAAQAAGTVGAAWLPAQDPANEVARLIQNMALVLNQPPPVLPPNTAVAKGVSPAGEPVAR